MSDQGDRDPVAFSLQQQPFVKPLVRLRNDDPEYNKKSSGWVVALKVVASDAFIWAVDRFVFNYPYARIGPQTWKNNFKLGWEWDTDRFGMNFFFHPYSGAFYFNSARASGYRLLRLLAFCLLGQPDLGIFRGNHAAGL